MAQKQKRIIIIGAGIGGMACAARLAGQGCTVTVVERNAEAGGKLGLLQQDGWSWDTGPSLFTQPYLLEDLFHACGRELKDYFTYTSLDEGTQYFWEDGTAFHASPSRDVLAANISRALHTAPEPLFRYLDDAARLYKNIGSLFLDEPIHRLRTWKAARILPALKALKPAYLFQSLHAYNAHIAKHPKLVQLLDRMATYNGSDPYQCPAMLGMIAHLELNEGAWYPQGGMISIPRALRSLCEDLGVTFITSAAAQRIIYSNGRVNGVLTDDGLMASDAVVSNSDVYFTYRNLLQDAAAAARIAQQERSSSGIIFYWGMRKIFPQLRLHNIFFSDDYEAEFRAIFRKAEVCDDPTIYINITAKVEAAHAPAGCENWFVLINTPASTTAMDDATVMRIRNAVITKLSRMLGEDISPLIQTESVLTPASIESSTGSFMGALYGTASNNPMAAFRRHPNYSKKYPGLFFAGGTVHPGGGIPLCLRSGKLAADEAVSYLFSF